MKRKTTLVDDITKVGGCKYICSKKFIDDRGTLCFAEGESDIPFKIERIFWIYGVPNGQSRGGHSHSTCNEVLFAVSGSCDIRITDGINETTVKLSTQSDGILISADVWCDLHNFSADCILIVAASQHYNVEGYTHSYTDYLAEHNK